MAKKKPTGPKTLRRPEAALSGLGVGSLVRIVLLAVIGIGGAIGALWVHYRHPLTSVKPAPSASSSDGIEYIDIDLSGDLDAAVLPSKKNE
jgi:hypothetical protein